MKLSARFLEYRVFFFLLIVFAFIVAVNFKTPLIGEDFGLSPIKATWLPLSFGQRITFIAHRIWLQYTQWNSRLGEQIAILFLGFNKTYFNLFNSLLATALIPLVFIYAFGRWMRPEDPDDLIAVALIFALYLCFLPHLGEVTYWLAGSSNYMWGVAILMGFFLPYRLRMFSSETRRMRPISGGLWTIAGFFAGLTNENTVPVFILVIGLIIIAYKKRDVPIEPWMYSGLGSLSLGYLALMLSPSTTKRIRFYSELFGAQQVYLSDYILRLQRVAQAFLRSSKYYIIIFLVIGIIGVFVHLWRLRHQNDNREHSGWIEVPRNLKATIALLCASLISALILIGNAYFEDRAFLLINLLLIAAIVALIFYEPVYSKFKPLVTGFATLLVLFTLWHMNDIYTQYSAFYAEAQARHEYILESRENGENSIKVEAYKAEDTRVLTTREVWLLDSGQYKLYYDVDEIRIVQP